MWFDEEFTMHILRSLIGERLREVRYLFPSEMATLPLSNSSRVHEVDHGVQLATSYPVMITLMWQMDGECAALSTVEGSGHDAGITDLIDSYDVSDTTLWRPLIGHVITNVGVAWHRSEGGCPTTPWAFRFELGEHGSFVVALAEIRGETLEYMPNNIAVLFDRPAADSLRFNNGDVSSWGDDI